MESRSPLRGSIQVYRSTAPSTGAKTVYSLGSAYRTFALQGGVSTGAGSTKATVQLQGSLDGSHWKSLGGTYAATTTWGVISSTNTKPVSYVRLNINSFSTRGGSTGPDIPLDLTVNIVGVP